MDLKVISKRKKPQGLSNHIRCRSHCKLWIFRLNFYIVFKDEKERTAESFVKEYFKICVVNRKRVNLLSHYILFEWKAIIGRYNCNLLSPELFHFLKVLYFATKKSFFNQRYKLRNRYWLTAGTSPALSSDRYNASFSSHCLVILKQTF